MELQILPERQSKESDHKPVGIVTKKTPAHATKWDLNKIDERLRNKKKDKGLKCRFEWFLAVNDACSFDITAYINMFLQ